MNREKEGAFAYRLRVANAYQIGETESWFTDMAAEGYHLEKAGFWRYKFRRGEAQRVNYRVDLSTDITVSSEEEQKQMYEDCGWEYVTKFGEFRVFRSPEEEHAPEIHTDPAEQAFTLRRLEKKLTGLAVFVVVASIVILALLCAVWFMGGTPILNLVQGQTLQQVFLTIIYIYLMINSVTEARSIRTLCSALREGRPIDHRADWRKSRKRGIVIMVVVLLLEIPVLAIPIIQLPQMINAEYYPLPSSEAGLPIVQLADIEQNPEMVRAEGEIDDWHRYENRYTRQWGVLASAIYDTMEKGEVPGREWEDESGTYAPSLSTEIFHLRIQVLAEPLAKELMSRYNHIEEIQRGGGTIEEMQDDRFDYAAVARTDEETEVVAVKGKNVIYLRYYGYAKQDRILDVVSGKL